MLSAMVPVCESYYTISLAFYFFSYFSFWIAGVTCFPDLSGFSLVRYINILELRLISVGLNYA